MDEDKKNKSTFYVIKRDGSKSPIHFDEILERINGLCDGLNLEFVNPIEVAKKVIAGLYNGVHTSELDEIAAETAFYMSTNHPDFAILAFRLAMSNLEKNVLMSTTGHQMTFSEVTQRLYENKNYNHIDNSKPLIDENYYNFVMKHKEVLNKIVQYERNMSGVITYSGLKTISKSYLQKCPVTKELWETPQDMFMRVAVWIHMHNEFNQIDKIQETYDGMSNGDFIHASPTLFNAGTLIPQLSSCFLLNINEDSIDGIFKTLKDCAMISRTAGGIGIDTTCVRSTGSYIQGTNGVSNGLVPMIRVFNETARYVDQGGGKRKGAFAFYVEPWHADIENYLKLRKNHGNENERARDLFYGLWIPDLFMKRVDDDDIWTLFSPSDVPGLHEAYGEEFEMLYKKFESSMKSCKTIKARELWNSICESQMETGTPYMLYKDACNSKSNHKHRGPITLSNLCTEIVQYTSRDEIAVCNLASICLPKFVCTDEKNQEKKFFDFERMRSCISTIVENLDIVISINECPVIEATTSNAKNRPMGIGVQGLADVFAMMDIPFDSPEARTLNSNIFEHIYYAAVSKSFYLATKLGAYPTFQGSPVQKDGQLQFDMWKPDSLSVPICIPKDKWDTLKANLKLNQCGLRNSLLIAPMPTVSTSQIFGNNECFEPFSSNMFTRRTLAGEFISINHHLVKRLTQLGLWSESMRQKLILNNGSVQNIKEIPQHVKNVFKTAFELSQRVLIDMAADRGRFICQSQSLNIFMKDPNIKKLSSMHFYGWRKGLKTGMYYLRTKAAADAIKFTLDPNMVKDAKILELEQLNNVVCESCSA